MTKKELSQLYWLNKEIKEDRKRLSELEGVATNTAVRISGLPHVTGLSNKTALAAEIADIRNIIEAKNKMCIAEYNRLNRYIMGVEDSVIRQIMQLRFVEGMRWIEIANRVGGNNTADSTRKIVDRFLNQK